MKRNVYLISLLQVIAAVTALFLFFSFIPWVTASPISDLPHEMEQNHPPPAWAEYFSVNHAVPTYYEVSPREEPFRALLHGCALLFCIVFLINSARHFTKLGEADLPIESLDRES